jgi:hypothetical protein
MEVESARLATQIQDSRQTKRDVLAEMVEVERQVRQGGSQLSEGGSGAWECGRGGERACT